MKQRSSLAVLALALCVGPALLFGEDQQTFQGKFEVVKAQREGKSAPDVIGRVLAVAGNSFQISAGDKILFKGTIKIDSSNQEIWKIDFVHSDGDLKGKAWLGIMRETPGDMIEICDNAVDPAKPRPEKFEGAPDSGAIFLTFKRK